MCALDFHLFEDVDHAVLQNIVNTSSLPKGHASRYDNGTPKELASAMVRTWEHRLGRAAFVSAECRGGRGREKEVQRAAPEGGRDVWQLVRACLGVTLGLG